MRWPGTLRALLSFLTHGERIGPFVGGLSLKRRSTKKTYYSDAPAYVDLRESILELRKIYHDLSAAQFAKLYHRRYKVPKAAILKVIKEWEEKGYEGR